MTKTEVDIYKLKELLDIGVDSKFITRDQRILATQLLGSRDQLMKLIETNRELRETIEALLAVRRHFNNIENIIKKGELVRAPERVSEAIANEEGSVDDGDISESESTEG